jgi:hypothetical protein
MIKCPKCGSTSTTNFEKQIHIVEPNGNIKPSTIYGCENCFLIFTHIDEMKPKSSSDKNVDKVQSIFSNISKGCNNILGNIK